jgi:hypothetical protein
LIGALFQIFQMSAAWQAVAPEQEEMKSFCAAVPTIHLNNRVYYQRPKGVKWPVLLAILFVGGILGYAAEGYAEGYAQQIVFLLVAVTLWLYYLKAMPIKYFGKSADEKFELLEQGFLENPVDSLCSCQKTRVHIDGVSQGYIQPARRCDSGCCYEIGCLCSGQAIRWKVYINEGGEMKLNYTIRETVQCCGCCRNATTKVYNGCAHSIMPYVHYKQAIYPPDLDRKTVLGHVTWVEYRGGLMSFGSTVTADGSKKGASAVADSAVRLALPILYSDRGAFPPSGVAMDVSETHPSFLSAPDVVKA